MLHNRGISLQRHTTDLTGEGTMGAGTQTGLADLASESVIVCDAQGIVRYWNPASEALYGWPALAVVGHRLDEFFPDYELEEGHWRQLLREGTWQGTVRRQTAAGALTTASVTQTVRYKASGLPHDIVEYGKGISTGAAKSGDAECAAPHRATAACWELDVSEVRDDLERIALADGDTGALLARDPDGLDRLLARCRIVNVNEKAVRIFGGTADRMKLIARPILDFWPSQCRPMLVELLAMVLAQQSWRITQTRAMHSDGPLQNASAAAWRSLDQSRANTIYLMISGILSDDRSVRELHVGEDRYRKLIHHMPTALWQVDARASGEVFDRLRSEGVTDIASFLDAHEELIELSNDVVRVTEVNREAVALFRGRSAADLIRPVRYLFTATPDMAKRVMIAHFEGRRNFSEQAKILTFDGQLRDVILSVTFSTPPEQLDTTFLTMLDITERLRTEAQLQRLEADYAHAARISTLGELATSIAHEVKQPLAAIVTNAETSLRWLERDNLNSEKVKQLTKRIVSSAYRANEIIQRIRSLAARKEPERKALDLHEVAEEALTFVRHDIEFRRIAWSIDAAPGPATVLGDRVQLQQVIVNLLVNSIQAISQGDRAARRINIAVALVEDSLVELSVRDSGPGIATEAMGRLFESFFTTKPGGVGIGLAICQSIIRSHGGCIRAANQPGGGARVSFTLPAIGGQPVNPRPF
ncbi:ATP-binding protein [uncultured Reyranella sp.]|uniref:PAS domain-containing sensor histidine kinase n=1 Tax=uncultured Reyranella sp. TaxID=735512 RepID=UPI0025E5FCF5|nr:ATP-binding protein [uncultured Reyranella sp.]